MSNLSVVILAKNEQNNIADAIESVKQWVSEVIVVDMNSSDRTCEIARNLGARIIFHEDIELFDQARTPGVLASKTDWVLILDADERVGTELAKKIQDLIANDSADVVNLPFHNYIFPGFSSHYNHFCEYHRRLFKKSCVEIASFHGRVHSFYEPKTDARIVKFAAKNSQETIIHFSLLTIGSWLHKVEKYTFMEVLGLQQSVEQTPGIKLLTTALKDICKSILVHYFKRGAYKDGLRGLFVAFSFTFYQIIKYARIFEFKLRGSQFNNEQNAKEFAKKLMQSGGY